MKNISKYSKFSLGLLTGILGTSLLFSGFVFASSPIKLIINGKEIQCEVPPTVIQGKTMVMARDVAENLGCQVSWNQEQNAVVIQSGVVPSDLGSSNVNTTTNTTLSNTFNSIPYNKTYIVQQDNTWYASARWLIEVLNNKSPNQVDGIIFLGNLQMNNGKEIPIEWTYIGKLPYCNISTFLENGMLSESDLTFEP